MSLVAIFEQTKRWGKKLAKILKIGTSRSRRRQRIQKMNWNFVAQVHVQMKGIEKKK